MMNPKMVEALFNAAELRREADMPRHDLSEDDVAAAAVVDALDRLRKEIRAAALIAEAPTHWAPTH